MKVRVLLFALLRERLGQGQLQVELAQGATVGALIEKLDQMYPSLRLRGFPLSTAVNQEYAEPAQTLHEGDEVALIPPVSGGAP